MATGNVFEVSRKIAKGYDIPNDRPIKLRRNPAGVTAIMGLTNGTPAKLRRLRARKAEGQPRDEYGRFLKARSNQNPNAGDSEMIVLENRRGRGRRGAKRRGRKAGRRSFGRKVVVRGRGLLVARRNEGFEFDSSSSSSDGDMGGLDMFSANGRRRRSRKAKSKGRKSARRRFSSRRGARTLKRRMSRRGRKSARRTFRGRRAGSARRRSSRGHRSYGRAARKSTRGRKSYRRSSGGRKYRRNSFEEFTARRGAVIGATPRTGAGSTFGHFKVAVSAIKAENYPMALIHLNRIVNSASASGSDRARAAKLMNIIRSRQAGRGVGGGADPYSWARNVKWGGVGTLPASFKALQKKFRDPGFTQEALAAARAGVMPRQIFRAISALNEGQAKLMFPDYRTYRAFMSAMNSSRTFRKFKGRYARGKYRFAGRRRSYGRKRYGRKSYGRGRKRYGKSYGRGRRSYSRGRGRSYGRRWGRRRSYRRNEGMFEMNEGMDYLKAGLAAVGGFVGSVLLSSLGRMAMPANKYAGLGGGLVGLVAAFLLRNKIFDNDLFAKGLVLGAAAAPAWSAVGIVRGTAGYGAYASTQPRYAMAGNVYQAAAGPFLQAAAGPFMQAAAGMGEYYAGDGSVSPVSDFGEYVASNLQVQGYGDYEVSPSFRGSSDAHGYGYINDGVRPDSNLGNEFNMMEAAAGLGAMQTQSDYIPSGGALSVASSEQTVDTGIFDVGGSNGVFG